MTKLEKVINGLEHCTREVIDAFVDECSMCPYKPTNDDEKNCVDRTQRDALELLKEQEPVEPKEVKMYPPGVYACGSCGHTAVGSNHYHAKFCPECGRAVKWE